jgi:hypothetical protein
MAPPKSSLDKAQEAAQKFWKKAYPYVKVGAYW